jgi:hypothetical protein
MRRPGRGSATTTSSTSATRQRTRDQDDGGVRACRQKRGAGHLLPRRRGADRDKGSSIVRTEHGEVVTARAGEVIYLPAGASNSAQAEEDTEMVSSPTRPPCTPTTSRQSLATASTGAAWRPVRNSLAASAAKARATALPIVASGSVDHRNLVFSIITGSFLCPGGHTRPPVRFTNSSWRAASQSCGDTIGGIFIAGLLASASPIWSATVERSGGRFASKVTTSRLLFSAAPSGRAPTRRQPFGSARESGGPCRAAHGS